MKTPMSETRTPWIEATLARLTPDQKLAQLMHTTTTPDLTPERWREHTGGLTPGGVFIFPGTREAFRRAAAIVQDGAVVPVAVSSDAENGPARLIKDATEWPEMMGMGAADDETLSVLMGECCAAECRDAGVHWTFGPVVDLNVNPHNPITNTRSLGERPPQVIRHATAMIRAIQAGGVATTPKHFPGDGFDDRDQHLCTTVNPQEMDAWWRTSGAVFKAAIDAGAWSVMIGHIALPAWDPGTGALAGAPPATVSSPLLQGLLRHELGFDGLVLTDATGMGGVSGWAERRITLPAMLMAGCDQLLFVDLQDDLQILRDAIAGGRLTWERVDACLRKILRLKELLGLTTAAGAAPRPVAAADLARFQAGARTATEGSLTLVKDRDGALPVALAGKRVLAIHLRGEAGYPIDAFDGFLRDAGAEVTCLTEADIPHWPPADWLDGFDLVILAFAFNPNWGTHRIRPNGAFMRPLASKVLAQRRIPVVGVSFGSPYHLHDLPQLPALINCYSQHIDAQRAAVDALSGRLPCRGISPVDPRKVLGNWSSATGAC